MNFIKGLNFEELVFWAFNDSLYNIKWRYSLKEIRTFIQVKVAEKQTDAMKDFEIMIKVLALAFGGDKAKETKIQSKDQLQMALNKMKS
jgi:hypothetical protein